MSMSSFPGGFETGILLRELPILSMHSGSVFWLDSNTSSGGLKGTFRHPVKTFATAMDLCTANKGDVIMIKPGHAETIADATSLLIDVAGVTVIGLGTGSLIPTFTCSAAASTLSITVANAYVKNIQLLAEFTTGCTQAVLVGAAADGLVLDGIQCRDTTADKEWKLHISVATTVTDLTIKNCSLIGLAGGSMTNSILFAGTTSNVVIANNWIDVDSSASTIEHSAGKATQILVADNIILNEDTDATTQYCVELKSDATGHVVGNRSSYANTGAACYVGAAAFFIENYGGNTAGSSGELDPAGIPIP